MHQNGKKLAKSRKKNSLKNKVQLANVSQNKTHSGGPHGHYQKNPPNTQEKSVNVLEIFPCSKEGRSSTLRNNTP